MSAFKKNSKIDKSHQNDKENLSLRGNYSPKKDKKFIYHHTHEQKPLRRYLPAQRPTPASQSSLSELQTLRKQLKQQREKVKYLQARTIKQQCNVLEHLEMLQTKFQEISHEKSQLELEMQKMRGLSMGRQDQEEVDWKERYLQTEAQHKKVKKIADGLIDMMKKVDGVDGNLKDAWRWVKKIVWEYEGIRKKALEWKQVYDQVTQAVDILDKTPNK